ncbi:RNA-directed DNA polymerase, partial [Candidatus Saccharibacteria bacterium]|nr:RNA-directed DNA polymerase [Candidatus Saccharibacteria bacterium]
IVIGNLTSQLLSNIYLDQLDHYVKHDLGHRNYGRYVDDFWLISTDKERLMADCRRIKDYLRGLGLTLHPKKIQLQTADKGVAFLGAVVYPHRIVPGKRLKAGVNRAVHEMAADKPGAQDSLQSYYGLTKHYRSKKLWERALRFTGLGG